LNIGAGGGATAFEVARGRKKEEGAAKSGISAEREDLEDSTECSVVIV